MIDYWNELIKLRDKKSTSDEIKKQAFILLKQLNTAGGKHIMKDELDLFLSTYKPSLYGTNKIHSINQM